MIIKLLLKFYLVDLQKNFLSGYYLTKLAGFEMVNIDFNLSQFGLFIDNDTLFMTVHINDFINYISF